MEAIIVALIGGFSVAVPSVIATIHSNRKSNAIIEYKIQELTDKVHEHNNLIDRTYKLESRVSVLENKIS